MARKTIKDMELQLAQKQLAIQDLERAHGETLKRLKDMQNYVSELQTEREVLVAHLNRTKGLLKYELMEPHEISACIQSNAARYEESARQRFGRFSARVAMANAVNEEQEEVEAIKNG